MFMPITLGIYAMLAEAAGYDTALIVKGVEGGVVPSLQASSKLFLAREGEPGEPISLKPGMVGIRDAETRAVPAPDGQPDRNAALAADHGLAALGGAPGVARDSLVYAGAIALFGTGKTESLAAGAEAAGRALDSGEALRRFENAA
jgi:anthranilate phosphoribosyltransferase